MHTLFYKAAFSFERIPERQQLFRLGYMVDRFQKYVCHFKENNYSLVTTKFEHLSKIKILKGIRQQSDNIP